MTVIEDELKEKAKELWLEGKKYREISEITGIKESTLKSFASRYWKKEKLQPFKKKVAVAIKVATENNDPEITEILPEEVEVLATEELNDKQRLFCLYYTKWFNATKAYQKVYGCTYASAMSNGCKLMSRPKIKEHIQAIKDAKIKKSMYSSDDIFQKMIDIAYADATDYISFGQDSAIIDGIEIPDIKVNTVKLKESDEVDGTLIQSITEGKNGISLKLISKEFALKWLDKNIGMANEETKARVDLLKAQAKKAIEENVNSEDHQKVTIVNDLPG